MVLRWLKGPQNLLLRSFRGAEWRQLLDYASPSFFEVVPPRALWSQARELASNVSRKPALERVRAGVEDGLRKRGLAIHLTQADVVAPQIESLDEDRRRARGQCVLELYFAQLYASPATLLDLRFERLAPADERLPRPTDGWRWQPGPYWVEWDADFLGALRGLYAGFYRDDDAAFEEALATLRLEAARDVFLSHFGEGDQRAVHFRAEVFHSTFHEAFVRCRDAGVSLHPNFVALGIYLAALYDHLGRLGVALDVRDAFERGHGA